MSKQAAKPGETLLKSTLKKIIIGKSDFFKAKYKEISSDLRVLCMFNNIAGPRHFVDYLSAAEPISSCLLHWFSNLSISNHLN